MLKKNLLALATITIMALPATVQAGGKDAEIAMICEKAAARYQELFGKEKLPDNTVVVTTYKFNFCPKTITVKPGTTVRWVNVDKRTSHSVWPKEANMPESERFFPDESFEIKFDDEGTYPYLCGPHWERDGMIGNVKVTK
ncbi:MAG: plastocyanin/azurin family copper-binding protein [Alphaproteobacteria bacterium]|nr:plastocyanin/azurin family copper-binding protein [Rhodospirillales bacterium]MCW9044966.1 plastocyanin/azurin family copper-binding protein [Alphaproteobacteria bacterium]